MLLIIFTNCLVMPLIIFLCNNINLPLIILLCHNINLSLIILSCNNINLPLIILFTHICINALPICILSHADTLTYMHMHYCTWICATRDWRPCSVTLWLLLVAFISYGGVFFLLLDRLWSFFFLDKKSGSFRIEKKDIHFFSASNSHNNQPSRFSKYIWCNGNQTKLANHSL